MRFVLSLILFSSIAAANPVDSAPSMERELAEIIKKYGLQDSQVAIEAEHLRLGSATGSRPLMSWRAEAPMIPASVIKVVTTAAALQHWGPSYRFKTEFFVNGPVRGGVLDGDLIIKGYGDPSMVSEQLWRAVRDLRDRGLREVRGRLIGDDSAMASRRWRSDFKKNTAYNSGQSALSLNYNHLQVWVHPTAIGEKTQVVIDPPVGDFLKVVNRTRTVAGSGEALRFDWQPIASDMQMTLTVDGSLGLKSAPLQTYRSLALATPYFLAAFREMFTSVGGSIRGATVVGKLPEGAKTFYTKESEAFLAQTLILMNKYSNNFIGDQLLMILQAENRSEDPLGDFMRRIGISTEGAALVSGSGLSRDTRISARQLTAVMGWANQEFAIQPEFAASLSIFGADGTTRRRSTRGLKEAVIRTKSGHIDNVNTLVGYLQGDDPAPVAFAILLNAPSVQRDRGHQFQSEVLKLIAERVANTPPVSER